MSIVDCETLCPSDASSYHTAHSPEGSRAASPRAAAPPAFLVYGSKDTLVRPSTQGRPLAAAWAAARGDAAREPSGLWAVWYEEASDGHNVSQSTIDMSALTDWLSSVLDGRLR